MIHVLYLHMQTNEKIETMKTTQEITKEITRVSNRNTLRGDEYVVMNTLSGVVSIMETEPSIMMSDKNNKLMGQVSDYVSIDHKLTESEKYTLSQIS